MTRRRGGHLPGGWRGTEVWLDPGELHWFGERRQTAAAPPVPTSLAGGAAAVALPVPAVAVPAASPRARPRLSRGYRLATRLLPILACLAAIGFGAVALYALFSRAPAAGESEPIVLPTPVEAAALAPAAQASVAVVAPSLTRAAPGTIAHAPSRPDGVGASPEIGWRHSVGVGVPHAGHLLGGVRLPLEGPNWATWDPVLDRVPNRVERLYGTDALVRLTLGVIASYRLANPDAPKVVIGDLSRRGGGEIDEHASHENGLDVDVYYPRHDGALRPPGTVGQIDVALAQDLLDRFVAAGAQVIFVGQSFVLRGPSGVVVPYPSHDNHMHVRISAP